MNILLARVVSIASEIMPLFRAIALMWSLAGSPACRRALSEDVRDTFRLAVRAGIGLQADVKMTSFLQSGVGAGGMWLPSVRPLDSEEGGFSPGRR